jgi:hypothetical protein
MDLQQNLISFLVQSSSVLSKLASILKADPDSLYAASSNTRPQLRWSDRVSRLLKKSYEDSLVILSEV